jgi:phospholipase/carboxylesterase
MKDFTAVAVNEATTSGLEFLKAGETRNPSQIIVALHGFGMNNGHMQDIAEGFAERFPGAMILVPNAPSSCADVLPKKMYDSIVAGQPSLAEGRSWMKTVRFSDKADDIVTEETRRGTEASVRAVNTLIDEQLAKHGLNESALSLYGYSQGGVIAQHAALARPAPCAAVVSHSGYFMGTDHAAAKPSTLLIVGEHELAAGPMRELHDQTKDGLRRLGVPVREKTCANLGHGINAESIDAACGFMHEAWTPKASLTNKRKGPV